MLRMIFTSLLLRREIVGERRYVKKLLTLPARAAAERLPSSCLSHTSRHESARVRRSKCSIWTPEMGRGLTKNPQNPLIALWYPKSKHGSCPRSCPSRLKYQTTLRSEGRAMPDDLRVRRLGASVNVDLSKSTRYRGPSFM
jgi:hypothetical protein